MFFSRKTCRKVYYANGSKKKLKWTREVRVYPCQGQQNALREVFLPPLRSWLIILRIIQNSKRNRTVRKFLLGKYIILEVALFMLVFPSSLAYTDVRIMSYNIKDFWLRFDGESGSITDQGATLDRDGLFLLF